MIQKKILVPERVRKIKGSFAFIEHRFLHGGFFSSLTQDERSLYLFLVLASDHSGLSYYSFDRICKLNVMSDRSYINARNSLIDKDLIAFDGYFFQVLSLPEAVFDDSPGPIHNREDMEKYDPATFCQMVKKSWRKS
ncbi:hypothetical protein QUF76_17185 [Desulfobacterales bacterium HSG16]|nr:hypothetical protein [Desulfobacterales bacterium HSG16]